MVYRHGVGLCALAADTPMKPARINAAEIHTVFLLNILFLFFAGFPFRLPAAASQCGAVFHDHPRYFSQGLPLSSPDEMGDRARTAPPPCGAAHRASGHSGGGRGEEGPATGGRIPPQSTRSE